MNDLAKDVDKFEERGDIPNAVVVSDSNSPAALTRLALTHGQSLADIEKMLELQIKYEKNEARKAYFDAVANFKAEAPPLKKDKFNKYFKSWYTSLGNLLDTYNPILGKNGLSVSFPVKPPEDNKMTVECRLSHKMGHSDSIGMTVPIDRAAVGKVSGQASRNAIQDIKSTFTYLRSATCEAVLGVAGSEASSVDDDGNSAGGQQEESGNFISADQEKKLNEAFKKTDMLEGAFLKALKVETLSELPASKFNYAMGIINSRKSK
jgi:hypothetical protein